MATGMSVKEMTNILKEAEQAGHDAMNATTPTPMIVGEPVDMFDLNSPIDYSKKTYHVSGGVCGFAWVSVRPANSRFANFLKKKGIGRLDGYEGGLSISIREGGQSLALKEAFASAYAGVLKNHGIKAYSRSRID